MKNTVIVRNIARITLMGAWAALLPGSLAGAPEGPVGLVTLAGNGGVEEFKDAMALGDGTLLVAGTAENLDWTNAPKTQLAPLGIPNRNTGRTALLLRLSADLGAILGVWHLPAGQAHDFRWLKGTRQPGTATGDIYLSGACDTTSGDYFIARLNANFVSAPPTGFAWVRVAKASGAYGDNLGLQSWDVGGDGRVAFVDETGGNLRVFMLDAAGAPMKLPGLRGSHWDAGAPLDGANRQQGVGAELPGTTVSAVTFPTDLRSWTDDDRLAVLPDGNGQIKRGRWPLDVFTPVRDRDGGTSGEIRYGYTGYRSAGQFRIGGIAIDRDTNDFAIGFNANSRFWDAPANKEQPDFEPVVIAYAADGSLKWWSRLYHEVIDANNDGVIDAGETQLSSPDQYVDGLAVEYSVTPSRLVVLARCHGNNTNNLWRGNQIAASPGAQGFHDSFTGTEGNIHIGWVAKLGMADGTLFHASYLAGYFRNTTLTQAPYTDPNLDGWPSHNAGWPNLTTTRAMTGSVRADAAGRVYVVGTGPRMVTTAGAWQKLPRITPAVNEGIAPWNQFARVFAPALDTLVYSTAITGAWTYPEPGAQPVGANNTDLYGIIPVGTGLIAVGRQQDTGNPVPTAHVPPWGTAEPAGVSALLARLPFAGDGGAGVSLPRLRLPATAVEVELPVGASGSATVGIENIGEGTLEWSAEVLPPAGSGATSPPGWLALAADAGTLPAAGLGECWLLLDSSGLAAGRHVAVVRLTSNDPHEPQAEVVITLVVRELTAIEAWRLLHFHTIENSGDAADAADPDGDGVPNLLEFALFGGDPQQSSGATLPEGSIARYEGESYLTLAVAKNTAADGITYRAETSGDLQMWHHGEGHTVAVVDDAATLIVRDAVPVSAAVRRFIRLAVTRP